MESLWVKICIITAAVSFISSIVIRFNDMKHLKDNFTEFKDTVWRRFDELKKETETQGERIARIEGRLNGNKNR